MTAYLLRLFTQASNLSLSKIIISTLLLKQEKITRAKINIHYLSFF